MSYAEEGKIFRMIIYKMVLSSFRVNRVRRDRMGKRGGANKKTGEFKSGRYLTIIPKSSWNRDLGDAGKDSMRRRRRGASRPEDGPDQTLSKKEKGSTSSRRGWKNLPREGKRSSATVKGKGETFANKGKKALEPFKNPEKIYERFMSEEARTTAAVRSF